jgi:quinoprotein glucose dehydrogenase
MTLCPIRPSLVLLAMAIVGAALPAVEKDKVVADDGGVAKALRLPAGFSASLYAQHPLFGNPVAIDVDARGRVLVAEQYRFNRGTEENRSSSFLLDDDLQVQTTDERLAMFTKWSARYQGGMAWFTKVSDKLRVLNDTDGDGLADHATVLAEFNEPLDGLNAGVLAIGDDIWATCIPNLWRLRDSNGDGVAEERVKIHSGFGVKASFLGHDLHALTLGMDGRLYFSIGDRGFHVVTREGTTLHESDNGAVLRCDLDGSHLEVVHHGLRNPQGLAFDEFGNLFAGDNNCDKGDKSRLIYIVDGGDSAWRMTYQSLGAPVSGGPWMSEELWQTESPLSPQWAVPAVGYIGAGPSGLRFSAVGAWPERLRNRFFHMNFVGNSGIITFKTEADGAGFRIAEYQDFLTPLNVSDCAFGHDGRLYVANYTGNPFNHDIGGQLYAVTTAETPAAEITALRHLAADNIAAFTAERLLALLDHPDQRIRLRAQFALAAKPAQHQKLLVTAAANPTASIISRLHAAWGLWLIARREPTALVPLRQLATDPDAVVRANALRTLADVGDQGFTAGFLAALTDSAPRAVFFAAEGLGRSKAKDASVPLIALLRLNAGADRFIQHAAVLALARLNDRAAVLAVANDPAPAVRLAVVLTLRRWGDARLAGFLADADDRIVLEAARAIHEVRVADAYPALAGAGERAARAAAPYREALQRRVLASARRLGDRHGADQLVRVIADPAASAAIRAGASILLAQWNQPMNRDPITGAWWPMAAGDVTVARAALAGQIDALFAAPLSGSWAPSFALLSSLGVDIPNAVPMRIANDSGVDATTRIAAFTFLSQSAPAAAADIAQAFLAQPVPELQSAALSYVKSADKTTAIALFAKLLGNVATPLSVKQTCLDELATLGEKQALPEACAVLVQWMNLLTSPQIAPGLRFDVLAAARRARAASPDLERLVAAFEAELATNKDPLAPYQFSLNGGNVERGAQVFATHTVAQCTRCHLPNNQPGGAGPNLAQIASTLNQRELLEALIVPSARLAPGYGISSITTTSGEVITGVIIAETASAVDIEITKGQQKTIATADITNRTKPLSLMPPMGQILQPRELRDVLAYVQTLRAAAVK